MKNILMTGGTGFLGASLLKGLLSRKFNVTLFVRRTSNIFRISDVLSQVKIYKSGETDIEDIFLNNKIDTIIHCATNYGTKDEGPVSVLETNLILPLKLLQQGINHGVTSFINTDTILDKGVNYYSLSKNHFKEWLKLYSDKAVCVNVALEHFYGPRDNSSKFVSMIIDSLISGTKSIDLTIGKQKRDFIYIDDVISAFMYILDESEKYKKGFFYYEIGSGKNISIQEMVLLVKRLSNNDTTVLNFGALPLRANEAMESKVDLSNIMKLGWIPKISLEEGLNKTIEYEKKRLKI